MRHASRDIGVKGGIPNYTHIFYKRIATRQRYYRFVLVPNGKGSGKFFCVQMPPVGVVNIVLVLHGPSLI